MYAIYKAHNFEENIGDVKLINARDKTEEVEKVVEQGYDLDEGMVFFYQGVFYHGHEAVNMMAILTDDAGFFNTLNKVVFRSPKRAKIFYPPLRFFRNLTLKVLGKSKIHKK